MLLSRLGAIAWATLRAPQQAPAIYFVYKMHCDSPVNMCMHHMHETVAAAQLKAGLQAWMPPCDSNGDIAQVTATVKFMRHWHLGS
jgi:hypothetical protein